jgi:hypothetical protein
LDLDVHRVGDGGDLQDPEDRFLASYGLGPQGAALLRPDGFISWRAAGDGAPEVGDAGTAVDAALARMLGRS